MQAVLESAGQDPPGSGPPAFEGRLSSTPMESAARAQERDAGALTWLAFALILALVLLATGWIAAQL